MRIIAVIFFLLFIVQPQGKAQQYNYYQYDVRNGLSGNTVYAITQDKDDFIWFGTETGLSRFDGSNFKNYTEAEGLFDHDIINLFVDSKNRVWIFPFKNAVYYYYQGKIHNSSNDSLLKKFNLRNEIFRACEDKNGNIFFLEQQKVHVLSANNELTEFSKIDGKNFYNNYCGIAPNGNCNIYLVFLSGSKDYDVNIYEYSKLKLLFKDSFFDSGYTKTAFEVNEHYNVIKDGSCFRIINQKNKEHFKLDVPKHFQTVSYLNDSCFTISTFNKTLLYNVNQKKIIDSFLINKIINRCFSDKENNLWFASTTQGAYRLSSTKFRIYRFDSNFNYMPVYAMSFYGENIYFGSENGLLGKINLNNNKFNSIYLNEKYNISHISDMQANQKGLFIGNNTGLLNLNYDTKQTYAIVSALSVKNFCINNNSVLIATDRMVLDIPFSNYKYHDTIWASRATCAYKFNNQYYIGTLRGLFIVNNDAERSRTNLGEVFPILKDKIISIKSDSSNNLWIATESNGLIEMKDNKIVHQITTKNGLTSNLCKCLYITGKDVWIGTDKGINQIDISHKPFKVTNFTAADGLDCEIINCIYVRGDSVFAGTPFGISFFKTGVVQSRSICNLKLLDIQSKKSNWYFKQDSIHLSINDDYLRFEYAGISFISAGDITYYYQLKGSSNGWDSTKQNVVEFQSLRPGKYEFNIYAVNKNNVRSKTITVAFTKAKPFWQLLWVQFILIVVLGVLFWLIVRARINTVRKKENEKLLRERKINELEQMALRAQMNPHFIFNSLNSIQQYVFAGDVIEANEFITNFSSLVRQTLYMSGKKFITLAEEIQYLESYLSLEQLKYENRFTFNIVLDEAVDNNTPLPSLLIQPFIENSIRHGILNLKTEPGKILVRFFKENNFLFCIVEDNGIGREKAMLLKTKTNSGHQSKGMEMVQKRIESLNSIYNCNITVAIEDITENDATGTRAIIKLPLHYDE